MNLKSHSIYLTIFISFLLIYSCTKKDSCSSSYFLDVPINLSPNSETYNVGDSINISIVMDNTSILDLLDSGRIVNYPNFDPKFWFLFPRLDTFPIEDGTKIHDIVVDDRFETNNANIGYTTNTKTFTKIDTSELESRIEFYIKLKEKGTYALYFMTSLYIIDQKIEYQDFPDRCGELGQGELLVIYDIDDNNYHLSENELNNVDEFWQDLHQDRFDAVKYYFKVE